MTDIKYLESLVQLGILTAFHTQQVYVWLPVPPRGPGPALLPCQLQAALGQVAEAAHASTVASQVTQWLLGLPVSVLAPLPGPLPPPGPPMGDIIRYFTMPMTR